MPRLRQRFIPEQRTCKQCGDEFTATRQVKIYCTKKCSREAAEKYGNCAGCGKKLGDRNARHCHSCGQRKRYGWTGGKELVVFIPAVEAPLPCAARAAIRTWVAAYCRICGQSFVSSGGLDWASLSCNEKCDQQWQAEKKRYYRSRYQVARRARIKTTQVEHIYRGRIYARDEHSCYLCGEQLNMDAQAPEPKAPTIDHVVPLARGGSHTYDNLRAACFECNSRKSDRTEDEYLLLINQVR